MDKNSALEHGTITLGVVIKSPWIDLILDGNKTWEIRGRSTKVRGRIALIKSKSGRIFGTCRIVDCLGPLSPEAMRENLAKHQVPLERFEVEPLYPETFAWVLEDAKRLVHPIQYKHPSGAVIWVRLTDENLANGGLTVLSTASEADPLSPNGDLRRADT